MKSLQVKLVVVNVLLNAKTAYRPFAISLGRQEVVDIYGLRVAWVAGPIDYASRIEWGLIQKSEKMSDDADLGIGPLGTTSRSADNDLLLRGKFERFLTSEAGINDTPFREMIWLPLPITVPRSPTLEVRSSSGTTAVVFDGDLYYVKRRTTDVEIRALMKQFLGRKQNVVSNVARVAGVDEGT